MTTRWKHHLLYNPNASKKYTQFLCFIMKVNSIWFHGFNLCPRVSIQTVVLTLPFQLLLQFLFTFASRISLKKPTFLLQYKCTNPLPRKNRIFKCFKNLTDEIKLNYFVFRFCFSFLKRI